MRQVAGIRRLATGISDPGWILGILIVYHYREYRIPQKHIVKVEKHKTLKQTQVSCNTKDLLKKISRYNFSGAHLKIKRTSKLPLLLLL